jgi:hypothetical protein
VRNEKDRAVTVFPLPNNGSRESAGKVHIKTWPQWWAVGWRLVFCVHIAIRLYVENRSKPRVRKRVAEGFYLYFGSGQAVLCALCHSGDLLQCRWRWEPLGPGTPSLQIPRHVRERLPWAATASPMCVSRAQAQMPGPVTVLRLVTKEPQMNPSISSRGEETVGHFH